MASKIVLLGLEKACDGLSEHLQERAKRKLNSKRTKKENEVERPTCRFGFHEAR